MATSFSELTDQELIERADKLEAGAGVSDWMAVFRELIARLKRANAETIHGH